MKRLVTILIFLSLVLVPIAATGGTVSAVNIFNHCGTRSDTSTTTGGIPDVCSQTATPDLNNNPIVGAIKLAIDVLSIIIGIGAVIGVLVSALRFTLAHGDSSAIANARSSLTYSLVGIVVTVLAQTIVIFVIDKLN